MPPPKRVKKGHCISLSGSAALINESMARDTNFEQITKTLFNGTFELDATKKDANSFFSCMELVNGEPASKIRSGCVQHLKITDVSELNDIFKLQPVKAKMFMDEKAINLFTHWNAQHVNAKVREKKAYESYKTLLLTNDMRIDIVTLSRFSDLTNTVI